MPSGQNSGDSVESLTVDSAAQAIEGLLSDDELETEQPADAEEPEREEESSLADSEAADEPGEEADPDSEDESPDDEESDPASSKPRTHKVKVNDQELEVPEEELIKGYSRTQDYTRKTMELAEQRKRFEQEELPAVRAERQQYHARLTDLEHALTSLQQEPDWDTLRTEDPALFAQTHAAWQIHQQRLNAISTERARTEQQIQADQAEQFRRHVATEQSKLLEKIPEWSDAEISKKEKAALLDYGREVGFADEELGQVADHRALVVLRKAMLYDQAQKDQAKAKPKAQEKIERVKVVAPGSASASKGKPTELTRRKQRLVKTGNVNDAASAIELMLDD